MCGIYYLTFDGITATSTLPTVCFSDWFTQRLLAGAIAAFFFFNIPVTCRMQCQHSDNRIFPPIKYSLMSDIGTGSSPSHSSLSICFLLNPFACRQSYRSQMRDCQLICCLIAFTNASGFDLSEEMDTECNLCQTDEVFCNWDAERQKGSTQHFPLKSFYDC